MKAILFIIVLILFVKVSRREPFALSSDDIPDSIRQRMDGSEEVVEYSDDDLEDYASVEGTKEVVPSKCEVIRHTTEDNSSLKKLIQKITGIESKISNIQRSLDTLKPNKDIEILKKNIQKIVNLPQRKKLIKKKVPKKEDTEEMEQGLSLDFDEMMELINEKSDKEIRELSKIYMSIDKRITEQMKAQLQKVDKHNNETQQGIKDSKKILLSLGDKHTRSFSDINNKLKSIESNRKDTNTKVDRLLLFMVGICIVTIIGVLVNVYVSRTKGGDDMIDPPNYVKMDFKQASEIAKKNVIAKYLSK